MLRRVVIKSRPLLNGSQAQKMSTTRLQPISIRFQRSLSTTDTDKYHSLFKQINRSSIANDLNKISEREFVNNIPLEKVSETLEDLVIRGIKASRELQLKNGSNEGEEDSLQKFLLENDNDKIRQLIMANNENIVKSYLLTQPLPDAKRVYRLITGINEMTRVNSTKQSDRMLVSENSVKVATRVILNNTKSSPVESFQVAVNLIDETVGGKKYVNTLKHNVFSKYIPRYIGGFIGVELATTTLFDSFFTGLSGLTDSPSMKISYMLGSYLFNVSFLGVLATLGLYNNKTTRIKWGPGANLWHKFLHHKELSMYDRVFIQYEELYDLNMDNFYLIGGNRIKSPEAIIEPINQSLQDYSGENNEVKTTKEVLTFDDESIIDDSHKNQHILEEKAKLLRFFRDRFARKKMKIDDFTEQELLFQEYWVTNGEKFEWVEPDQDPAEIKILQKYHVNR
ncbi:hypothetical protein DASC09_050210 [Saccharomycopsis crataegensis]|uniref:Uncharacterized protein n=1 Tax=Saccharomycopsis crataegensis TaxID=43959 RepID=A0AAV5QT09_9ASCO|nr:hypothetical protein DASC09_050210 [Saccharomycopsis crataegensis]